MKFEQAQYNALVDYFKQMDNGYYDLLEDRAEGVLEVLGVNVPQDAWKVYIACVTKRL